jgi:hypothetical protein
VTGDQFGHLEHADLGLAIEDDLQCIICIDHGLFSLVLETILFDVFPKLLRELATGKRGGSHDSRKSFVRLDRFRQSWIELACFGWFGSSHSEAFAATSIDVNPTLHARPQPTHLTQGRNIALKFVSTLENQHHGGKTKDCSDDPNGIRTQTIEMHRTQ